MVYNTNPKNLNPKSQNNSIFSNPNSQTSINPKEIAKQIAKLNYKEALEFLLKLHLDYEKAEEVLDELKKINIDLYYKFLGDVVEPDEYSYNPDLDDY